MLCIDLYGVSFDTYRIIIEGLLQGLHDYQQMEQPTWCLCPSNTETGQGVIYSNESKEWACYFTIGLQEC
jgi:hypothetical protein